jgi:hypothetical protein
MIGIGTKQKNEKCLFDFREDKMRNVAGVVALILLISFCAVSGQNWSPYYDGMSKLGFVDFNSSGFGARSRAMGGVYMATSNEAYSSFENPATMTFVTKSMMSAEFVNSHDKHKGLAEPRPLNSQTSQFYIGNVDYKNNRTKIDQASAVAPFTYSGRDWWVGGGFRVINDFNLKYDSPVNVDNPDKYERDKDMVALNLAFASKPIKYASVGVNMNFYTRRYEENYLGREFRIYDTSSTTYDYHYNDRSSFSGVNFDIGLMAEYSKFSFGAMVRTPYTLTQNAFRLYGALDPYGQDINAALDRITVKYKIPLSFALGVSAKPIENLTVAADFDSKPYSKVTKSLAFETTFGNGSTPEARAFTDRNADWNNLSQFRAGVEYILNAGFAQIPVRGGIHNIPNVQFVSKVTADSATVDTAGIGYHYNYEYSNKVNPLIISFGSGIKFEKIWFDIAYEFGSKEYAQTMVDQHQIVTGNLKFKYSRLYLSLGMLF